MYILISPNCTQKLIIFVKKTIVKTILFKHGKSFPKICIIFNITILATINNTKNPL